MQKEIFTALIISFEIAQLLSKSPCAPGRLVVAELPPSVVTIPSSIKVLSLVGKGRSAQARVVSVIVEAGLLVQWLGEPDLCNYPLDYLKCVVDARATYNLMVCGHLSPSQVS